MQSIHPVANAYLFLLTLITGLAGVTLAVGGTWMLLLGGTFYYAVVGTGLIAVSFLLGLRSLAAVWVYLGVFLFTVGWAAWEKGGDMGAQVPRLIGPLVMLVLILIAADMLWRTHQRPMRRTALLAIGAGAIALVGFLILPRPLAPPEPSFGDMGQTAALAAPLADPATSPTADGDWPASGGGYDAQRYTPLASITPDTASGLQQVWRVRTGDMPAPEADGKYSPENTQLKVGDSLLVCSASGIVMALDAATGEERWRHDPQVSTHAIP